MRGTYQANAYCWKHLANVVYPTPADSAAAADVDAAL